MEKFERFKVRLVYGDRSIRDAVLYKTLGGYVCRVFDADGYAETFPKKTKSAAKKSLFATKAFLKVEK